MNYATLKAECKAFTPDMKYSALVATVYELNTAAARMYTSEGYMKYSLGGGLMSTKEGLELYLSSFKNSTNTQVATYCTPQEVYDYEYKQFRCNEFCNDLLAMMIVCCYFPLQMCQEVIRKNALSTTTYIYFDVAALIKGDFSKYLS